MACHGKIRHRILILCVADKEAPAPNSSYRQYQLAAAHRLAALALRRSPVLAKCAVPRRCIVIASRIDSRRSRATSRIVGSIFGHRDQITASREAGALRSRPIALAVRDNIQASIKRRGSQVAIVSSCARGNGMAPLAGNCFAIR